MRDVLKQNVDTSCILAWLIEQGYEVYAFMANVGQEEVTFFNVPTDFDLPLPYVTGFCCCKEKSTSSRCKKVLPRSKCSQVIVKPITQLISLPTGSQT